MILRILIQNYILIDNLDINFSSGLSIITGETGAGKSILIGALSFISGDRANVSVIRNKEKKCLIEAEFNVTDYQLQSFFTENELDYDNHCIIRREILPNGKSRAFINDTPVNVTLLKDLSTQLIDIHSQHETLMLNNPFFHLTVIDSYAQNSSLLEEYQSIHKQYKKLRKSIEELKETEAKSKADQDYYQFLFNELELAKLQPDEQDQLEQDLALLSHAEEINTNLSKSLQLLDVDEVGVLAQLTEMRQLTGSLSKYNLEIREINERLNNVYVELKDLTTEIQTISDGVEANPERLEQLNQRLNLLFSLQQKHRVKSTDELIEIYKSTQLKLDSIAGLDEEIAKLEKELTSLTSELKTVAEKLSSSRSLVASEIELAIQSTLSLLGMPNAIIKIIQTRMDEFESFGIDKIKFNFSANKGTELQEISKAASGGELSRLMLSIKALISNKTFMPTIIFDEIDTGVSGDVASKVGNIIKQMSETFQVIVITHLPQIASKADTHYFVYKESDDRSTRSNIRTLKADEQVIEIAKMLSGEDISQAAIENAKSLLQKV